MILDRPDRSACRRHGKALLGIVDARVASSETTAALDHIEWCRPCADELQELALAVVAVRRLAGAERGDEGGEESWDRLKARIMRSRAAAEAAAWRWRTTLAGVAAGTMLVAAMIGPLAAHVPYGGEAAEPIGYSPTQLEIRNRQIELTYIWQSNTGTLFSTQPGPAATGYVGPRRYPDDVQPERKEVPAKPSGQPARVD